MSAGNFQYERKRNYELKQKECDVTDTIKTGTSTYNGIFENPVYVDDPAANVTITVPDGDYIGQTAFIACKSNSGSKTITLSVTHHYTSDPETFTISNEGQNLLLGWDGERWGTIGGTATAT